MYTDRPRLLDPSCSGSGIVNRLDHLLETGALLDTFIFILLMLHTPTEPESDTTRDNRLAKLAAFQLMMIKHAMRCKLHTFPRENPVANLHIWGCCRISSS